MSKRLLFGWHSVIALLEHHPERVIRLQLQQGREDRRQQEALALADRFGVAVEYAGRKAMDERSGDSVHQGVIAEVRPAPEPTESDLLDRLGSQSHPPFLLILDGVTDPHNLGACLRTADAAGVDAIVVPKDKSAPLSAAAIKVACGAAESVPVVRVTNLARFMRQCQEQGIWFTGTTGDAEQPLHELDLTGPLGLVMGAEGAGMRRLTREHCDQLGYLPMAGMVSSLNVSVATGVCLFEARRQRLETQG